MGAEFDAKNGPAHKRDVSQRKRTEARRRAGERRDYHKSISQWQDEIAEDESNRDSDDEPSGCLQTYWQSWATETLAVLEERYSGVPKLLPDSEMNVKGLPVSPKSVVCEPVIVGPKIDCDRDNDGAFDSALGVELDSKAGHARRRDVSQRKRASTTQHQKPVKRRNFRKTISQWQDEINQRQDSESDSDYPSSYLRNYWQNWAAETLAVLEANCTEPSDINCEGKEQVAEDILQPEEYVEEFQPQLVESSPSGPTDSRSVATCEEDCGVELISKRGHARKRDVSQRKRAGAAVRKKPGKRRNYRKTSGRWRDEMNERGRGTRECDEEILECEPVSDPSPPLRCGWHWATEILVMLERKFTGFLSKSLFPASTRRDQAPEALFVREKTDCCEARVPVTVSLEAEETFSSDLGIESEDSTEEDPADPIFDAVQTVSKGSHARKRDVSRRKRATGLKNVPRKTSSFPRRRFRKTSSRWRDEVNERGGGESDHDCNHSMLSGRLWMVTESALERDFADSQPPDNFSSLPSNVSSDPIVCVSPSLVIPAPMSTPDFLPYELWREVDSDLENEAVSEHEDVCDPMAVELISKVDHARKRDVNRRKRAAVMVCTKEGKRHNYRKGSRRDEISERGNGESDSYCHPWRRNCHLRASDQLLQQLCLDSTPKDTTPGAGMIGDGSFATVLDLDIELMKSQLIYDRCPGPLREDLEVAQLEQESCQIQEPCRESLHEADLDLFLQGSPVASFQAPFPEPLRSSRSSSNASNNYYNPLVEPDPQDGLPDHSEEGDQSAYSDRLDQRPQQPSRRRQATKPKCKLPKISKPRLLPKSRQAPRFVQRSARRLAVPQRTTQHNWAAQKIGAEQPAATQPELVLFQRTEPEPAQLPEASAMQTAQIEPAEPAVLFETEVQRDLAAHLDIAAQLDTVVPLLEPIQFEAQPIEAWQPEMTTTEYLLDSTESPEFDPLPFHQGSLGPLAEIPLLQPKAGQPETMTMDSSSSCGALAGARQGADALDVAEIKSSCETIQLPPSQSGGWTSSVLLKVGAWVSGLFGSPQTPTLQGHAVRVGAYLVQDVLHESDRCSVVLAVPSAEVERVACKLTAEPSYREHADFDFDVSPIGLEWRVYSQLQQQQCDPCAEGEGCRHDLLLKAYAAMPDVECSRPDGSVYRTNLLVLEEAAISLEGVLLQGPLQENFALVVFENLLAAVHTLHRHQICHRDLKPCQVLFSKEGALKLADLDTAAFFRDFRKPARLDAIAEGSDDCWYLEMLSDGTVGWMAPEVEAWDNWKGGQPRPPYYGIPIAADMWGCGQILLCMLLGMDGSGEAPPRAWQTETKLSPRARELLSALLELDPAHRCDLPTTRALVAQYWVDFGRPSDLEVTAEVVCRLRRPAGTKFNALGEEENGDWMIVNDSVEDDSWAMV